MVLTERDGSFRRLVEMVKAKPSTIDGRPGRPPKHRIPTTGLFALCLHERMRTLAKERTEQSGYLVSIADLYNEASAQLVEDLRHLLGEDFRLPAGALTLTGILGLRDLIARPVLTPLRDLNFQTTEQIRTTLYIDTGLWDEMLEMSMRFGLQLRRPIHIHRLLELSAAWYLAGFDIPY